MLFRRKLTIGATGALALIGVVFVAVPANATGTPKPFTLTTHTALTNRPDSGGGGNYWAKDDMTRTLVITETEHDSVYHFKATLTDVGTFTTQKGLTPNQNGAYQNNRERHVVTGRVIGFGTYSFTATRLPIAGDMPTTSDTTDPTGVETTSEWYKQAFPNGTVFDAGNAGILKWIWTYTYNQTAKVGSQTVDLQEYWVDSEAGDGQLPADGNIDGNKVVS